MPAWFITAIILAILGLVEDGKDPAGCWGQIATGGNPLIQIPAPQPQG